MVLGQEALEAVQKFRQDELLADDLTINLDSVTDAVLAFSSITLI